MLTRPCLVPRPPWQCFGMPPCRKAAPLSPSSSSPMLTPDEPLSRTPKAAVLTQAQKMSRLEKLKQKKIDEQLEIQVGCPQPLCLSAGFPHRTRTVASRLRAMRLRATPGGPSNGLTLPHWHRSSHPKLSSNGARGTGGGGLPQHAALQKILEGDSSRQKKEIKRDEALVRRTDERERRGLAMTLTHVKSTSTASGATFLCTRWIPTARETVVEKWQEG